MFVTVPTTLSAPPMVNAPLFVTVEPLRLTPPSTLIVPSLTSVRPAPSEVFAPCTVMVAPRAVGHGAETVGVRREREGHRAFVVESGTAPRCDSRWSHRNC